jgi:hypothetical protein
LASDWEFAIVAQFIELAVPGGSFAYIRCSCIERVECSGSLTREDIAPPDNPLRLILRDQKEKLTVYGCSVLDILHGIHQDGVFLNARDEGG